MENVFLEVSPDTHAVLEEAARFVCNEPKDGKVRGMPVKKQEDGSVWVPIIMMARVGPMERGEDMRWRNRITIRMPWTCPDEPELGIVYGSRVSSAMTGQDRTSLWYRREDNNMAQRDDYYDQQAEDDYYNEEIPQQSI